MRDAFCEIGEGVEIGLALLNLAFGKVDGARVHAGGRARLEAAHRKAEIQKVRRQIVRRGKAVRPRAFLPFPRDDGAVQIDARRQHDGGREDRAAVRG